MTTHYEVLGLRPGADAAAVKHAWRMLARLHHPDRNGEDSEASARFLAVVAAYQVLSHPERRLEYDRSLGSHSTGSGSSQATANGNGAHAPVRRGKVPDRAICMSIGYDMNVAGGVLRVLAPGVGRCASCAGTGRAASVRCGRCEGSGHAEPPRPFPVLLEPGMLDGGTYRIPNAGWPSEGGRGDLVVQLALEDPPGCTREGSTVHTTVRISRSLAYMGGEVTTPAPGGPVKFRIPPKTGPGERFTLQGRGLRSGPSAPRGDLVVTLELL